MLYVVVLAFFAVAFAAVELRATDFVNFADSREATVLARGSLLVNSTQWGFAVDVWGGTVNTGVAGSCFMGANIRGYNRAAGTGYVAAGGFAAATGVQLVGAAPWTWGAVWAGQVAVQSDGAGGLNVSAAAAGAVAGSIWTHLEEVDCGANSNDDTAVVYQTLLLRNALWALNATRSSTTGAAAKWCTFTGYGTPLTPLAPVRVGYTAVVVQEPVFLPRFNTYVRKRATKRIYYLRNWPYLNANRCLRTTFYAAAAAAAVGVVGSRPALTDAAGGLSLNFESNFLSRDDAASTDTTQSWRVGAWATIANTDVNIPTDAQRFFASKYGAGFVVRRLRLSTQVGGRCGATELCLYDPGEETTNDQNALFNISSGSTLTFSAILLALAAILVVF